MANPLRASIEDLLKRRFFYTPSFGIYGGVAGLYDFGPPGCAVKNNFINAWKRHFILEENMLEVDCTSLTPANVLATSGHVAKFTDMMVKDEKTGLPYRADHLLEEHLNLLLQNEKTPEDDKKDIQHTLSTVEDMNLAQMADALVKYKVVSPDKNPISPPADFNLMFPTQIGPTANFPAFLRPETAQGIFTNFKKLLEYNYGKIPFAAAQIGNSFRNEISPRAGLLRVREFTMAEIEHFVKYDEKKHPKFELVKNTKLNLFSSKSQLNQENMEKVTVGEAVSQGIIGNELLGYYMARTALLLLDVGVIEEKLRFRQHLPNEMAHYASDCWDAEIESSYGWVECVGHADRSCYDLEAHSKMTKEKLSVYQVFPGGPKEVEINEMTVNKQAVGKTFRGEAKNILAYLESLDEDDTTVIQNKIDVDGKTTINIGSKEYEITKDMIQFKKVTKKISGEQITPHVVEPSFGVGRILYSIFEHAFRVRENDEQRTYLALRPKIAPIKVSVLPLSQNEKFDSIISQISTALTRANISSKVDESSAGIGKRYARTDEIGIPFGVTVDFDTLENDTVTIRERDSMSQVRAPIAHLPKVLDELIEGYLTWKEVQEKYPAQEQSSD